MQASNEQVAIEQFDSAVRLGDAATARALLEQHAVVRARINEPRFDFDSPAIHQAKKNLPLVDVLLQHGANINERSSFWAGGFGILEWDLTLEQARPLISRGARVTPWAAAGLGLYDELETTIRNNPGAVNERGGDGKTVLHCAATPAIAALILDSGADIEACDVDHGATALQYLIGDEAVVRLLVSRGAKVDIFAAARLGDEALVERCWRADPTCLESRVNWPPFTAAGGHIYGWTLGFDLTPADVARKFGHPRLSELIVSRLSPKGQLIDALWSGDAKRVEQCSDPGVLQSLGPSDHALLPAAAWWYRPDAVRLMLEVGFDPHVRGAHRSTPLDRAAFHGYADIVEMLLAHDPAPPVLEKNEFGGMPLGACIHGSLHGWRTGHPQDHGRTLALLLQAGSPVDPARLPTGNAQLDDILREWLAKQPKN